MIQKLRSPAPVFRSDGQAAILQALRFAETGVSISELSQRAGLAISQVHSEVERLEAAGITKSVRVGRTRLVSLDADSPVAHEIASLVDKLLGVEMLLRSALQAVAGIDSALIFGSWAARRHGEDGTDPADVDLLVVGNADADVVFDAVRPVETIVGRPINVVVRTPDEWASDESGFARSVRSNAQLVVIGGAEDD